METLMKPTQPSRDDVRRAVQGEKKQYEAARATEVYKASGMPVLYGHPSPAEIQRPVFTHEVVFKAPADHVGIEQQDSAPQEIEVRAIHEAPVASFEGSVENQDGIPEEVVAEVAAKVSRKDFVAQQEDLFGANDNIELEDVPEGEITYEQYLAQRPVAKEDDFYHYNNRVYNAVPAGPMKNKKAIYEAKLDSTTALEHYDEQLTEANKAAVINEAIIENVIDEALQENDTKNESYDRTIRTNVEGEYLVEKEARLKGLLALGEEILALYNSELDGEEYEKTIKPALEAKKAIYDDLYELYENKGLDNRALWYIEDKTNARVEDPDFIPIEGSPYINGEKVEILDFVETPDGKKAYTIEKADGSIEAVYTSDVTFKREFEKSEAPEIEAAEEAEAEAEPAQTQEVPEKAELAEAEPEEKLSRFERAKKWFSKERRKYEEFGGVAYWGAQFGNPESLLSNRRINKYMSPAEVQAQKLENRRNIMIGVAALSFAGAAARTFGLGDVIPDTLGSTLFDSADTAGAGIGNVDGLRAEFVPHLPEAAPNAETVPVLPELEVEVPAVPEPQPEIGHADGGADFDPSTEGFEAYDLNNQAYEIPDGGGGIRLFEDLGMDEGKWNEHAQELLDRFPGSFELNNGDIHIVQPGLLPLDVREAIESFRNR